MYPNYQGSRYRRVEMTAWSSIIYIDYDELWLLYTLNLRVLQSFDSIVKWSCNSTGNILYFVNRVSRYNSLLVTNLTHFFYIFIYYTSLHVSNITVLIIRRSNCINTSSPDRRTKQSLTQSNHIRWCINNIRSPDDEHCDARNMYRGVINKGEV